MLKRPVPGTLIAAVATLLPSSLSAQGVQTGGDELPLGVTYEMVERGKAIFEGVGQCATCHGADAAGDKGPNLTDADWWHARGSYLAIVDRILSGVPARESVSGEEMPPRGGSRIPDVDVRAVGAYIWTVSHPDAGDSLPMGVTPALVARGQAVFSGQGGCNWCHAANAGGYIGPDLTDEEWLHAKGSYLAIMQQVLRGVPAEQSRTGIEMPPRGGADLSDEEVQSVAAYVWAISRLGASRTRR